MRIPLLTWRPGVQTGRYLVRFLLLVILVRLVRDASIRMMYPFLNEYAQGLGVSLATMGMLLMLRTWLVALAPFFGHRADLMGPKRILMAGFGLQGLGLLGMGLASGVWSAAAAILILGVSDAITYPLMQAYISEQAPMHRLGRALITVEYSWAITGIVILPIIGWLIGEMGWQTPFRLLSVFSGMAVLMLVFLLPPSRPNPKQQRHSFWKQIGVVARNRSALGSVLVSATIFIAAEAYFVTWGAHLARDFALTPERIGQVASGLGVIELLGSVLASFIIDPLGKRRGVIAGVVFFLGALIALIWLHRTLWTTLLGMGLVSLAIEYSIVSTIPLMAQQIPASRATVLALGAMAGAFTRSLTDPAAAWLLEHWGFMAAMAYSFLALAVALGLLWRWVQERATPEGTKSASQASLG